MSTTFPRYSYIISKRLDPLFALFIGLSAATLRVRREEIEKGHSGDLRDIGARMRTRAVGVWRGDFGIRGNGEMGVEKEEEEG